MSERAGERKSVVGAACQYATPIADAVLTARQQTHDRVPCAPLHSTREDAAGVVTYHVSAERRAPPVCCAPRRNPINVLISYTCVRNAYPAPAYAYTLPPFNSEHLGFSEDKIHES